MLVLCLALIAAPQGLVGGNAFKSAAFETKVLESLNKGRGIDAKKPVFAMDDTLRNVARRYAQLAASGDKQALTIESELKNQKLAPRGYRYQYVAGTDAAAIAKEVKVDFDVPAKAGVGAFLVPRQTRPTSGEAAEHVPHALAEPMPAKDGQYYQVLVILAIDADPMEGKPGLTPAQTDPVMNDASGRIASSCYTPALARNPNLKGQLVVQVVIADKGSVTSSKVLQGLGESEFDACALGIVSSLKFPEPYKGKPVTLNHPMNFVPPQGDKTIGYLSRAQIDATFATASQDLRSCYDDLRKQDPKLRGVITLSVDVNARGGVDAVKVTSNDSNSTTLAGCIVKRVYELHFPPPRYSAPLTLSYPLTFVPDK